MRKNSRNTKDKILQILISLVSLIGLFVLVAVFGYVVKNGSNLLSFDLLAGDYYSEVYDAYYDGEPTIENTFSAPSKLNEDEYFSTRWGIALKDDVDNEGHHIILVTYVDVNSPLVNLPDKNNEESTISVSNGMKLGKAIFISETGRYVAMLPADGAENAASLFDGNPDIYNIILTTAGKGIRGSLITTLYLIGMTLIVALPLGVLTAIYLHEFAPKNNRVVNILRRMIEMLTGVPSIIYGLLGAAVFIPFVSSITSSEGGNLITGSLTLAVIILPVIISSTEETLKTIPDEYRHASLALGATKSQTTFKVILKSAIPGILSAVLLSIGRIIGESAALIYAVGTAIKDQIIITERSTSLAVHIWSVMAAEVPNFELASAISILILIIVFILNLVVKLTVKKISN